jgi:hypothetical protein
MKNDEVLSSIAELRRGSRLSLVMVVLGVVFLLLTVIYSATQLRPLQQEVQAKRDEIAQLEARKAELSRFVSAAESAARPLASSSAPTTGWVYLGRVSNSGAWAPQSDRVQSSATPESVAKGNRIATIQNSSLVSDLDANADDGSIASGTTSSTVKVFIRPKTSLEVLEVRNQGSIGGGKLLWAKVQVQSDSLLQVGQ